MTDFVPIISTAIQADIPASAYQAYCRLVARAWFRAPDRRGDTMMVPTDELETMFGCGVRQVRNLLSSMERAGLLQRHGQVNGGYVLSFPIGRSERRDEGENTAQPAHRSEIKFPSSDEARAEDNAKSEIKLPNAEILFPNAEEKLPNAEILFPSWAKVGRINIHTLKVKPNYLPTTVADLGDALTAAGIFPNPARKLALEAATEIIFGWLAYYGDKKNRRGLTRPPGAVLCTRLKASERPTDQYMPKPVCALCAAEMGACECADPLWLWPRAYLDAARASDLTWGICPACRRIEPACRCGQHAEDSADEPEETLATDARARVANENSEADEFWARVLGALKGQMTQATYDTWVRQSKARWDSDGLVVVTHSPFAQDWMENRLDAVIRRTVAQIAAREIHVAYTVRSA